MNQKNVLTLVFVFLAALFFTGCANQPGQPAKEKVVLHLTDKEPYRWNIIYNNSKKMMEYLGPEKVEVEVVANAGGIQMLKADSTFANRVDEMIKLGIKVVACEETMIEGKITKADMNPHIGYVARGNLEIVRLQRAGWVYIKP